MHNKKMKSSKLLIIDLTENHLHMLEFVRPIEDIARNSGIAFHTLHASKIEESFIAGQLADYSHIILSGTSLKDFGFLMHTKRLAFLRDMNVPIMGICAGMQLLCEIYGCKVQKGSEIGLIDVHFKNFLGISGDRTIYCLHNMTIKKDKKFDSLFKILAQSDCIQAIKHKKKPTYGVLFHPEARNKEFIERFLYSN